MPIKRKPKVVFIGAGNLAFSLAPAFHNAGFEISQIYSRTRNSAQELASKFLTSYTTKLESIFREADVYVICVKDDAIKKISARLKLPGSLVLHTSGSTPLKSIEKISETIGVLYPLQTFTKAKKISLKKVPVLVEGNSSKSRSAILKLARKLSDSVIPVTSDDRLKLHIAAVFACNFSNHLYTIAEKILKGSSVKFSLLLPLIMETTKRIETNSPANVQTGPAIRDDKKTIRRHLTLLKKTDPKLATLYKLISSEIQRTAAGK